MILCWKSQQWVEKWFSTVADGSLQSVSMSYQSICSIILKSLKTLKKGASECVGMRRDTSLYVGKPVYTSDRVGFFFRFFFGIFLSFFPFLVVSSFFGWFLVFRFMVLFLVLGF